MRALQRDVVGCVALSLLSSVATSCGSRPVTLAPTHVQQGAQASAPNDVEATQSSSITPPALFHWLVGQMKEGVDTSNAASVAELPEALRELDYDAYRDIRFRPERTLWRGEPGRFEVQFFHPGLYYRELVDVLVADADQVYPFPFSTQLFDYGALARPESGAGLGFTGLRIHTSLERADYRDEVIVFQGASYFRSRGRGDVYGLSARGLSIDMGGDKPEEFPRFNQLYLVRPGPEERSMWVVATLVSERAHGVYAFRVTPGPSTIVDVFARVWVTGPIASLDVAPLSSMYWFGEEALGSFGDFRPEVHDSDGMAFLSAQGERLFRPLRNPPRNTRSAHRLDSPRGFGLVQRDRNFDSYQDLEAHYQDRPSAWIEPIGDWGSGALHLLELHSDREANDNIALAWVPDHIDADGLNLRYRLHWGSAVEGLPNAVAAVVATRVARTEAGARFLVDFAGGLATADREAEAQIVVTGGSVIEQHIEANQHVGGRRISFEVVCDGPGRELELRAFLRQGVHVLSETWSYLWQGCR